MNEEEINERNKQILSDEYRDNQRTIARLLCLFLLHVGEVEKFQGNGANPLPSRCIREKVQSRTVEAIVTLVNSALLASCMRKS